MVSFGVRIRRIGSLLMLHYVKLRKKNLKKENLLIVIYQKVNVTATEI